MQHHIMIWMIVWILYQLIQGGFIIGIVQASDGTPPQILPNNKVKHSEMILYPLRRFLLQSTDEQIFYKGEQLKLIVAKIMKRLKDILPTDFDINVWYLQYPHNDLQMWEAAKDRIQNEFMVHVVVDGKRIKLYQNIIKYKYSKWVRKPIIQCHKCMGSFWGIFTMFIPLMLIFGWHWWVPVLYIVNAVCLAFTSHFLYKRIV